MSDLTIITNNHVRDVVDAWELPVKQRKEFDYIDWDKIERGEDSASFIQYKGSWYDLGDFQPTGQIASLAGWDEYISDSFFSGILVKNIWHSGGEHGVVMGRYYS